jgi:peroxiredoxin (alkyl hydroperoxide reductase subunit C)
MTEIFLLNILIIVFMETGVKEMAEVRKEEMGFPILGQKAPDFEAVTTQGMLRLSDFKGTWLVLFSHPADFTPVCTTEFIAFSKIYDELKKRNVELLGLRSR